MYTPTQYNVATLTARFWGLTRLIPSRGSATCRWGRDMSSWQPGWRSQVKGHSCVLPLWGGWLSKVGLLCRRAFLQQCHHSNSRQWHISVEVFTFSPSSSPSMHWFHEWRCLIFHPFFGLSFGSRVTYVFCLIWHKVLLSFVYWCIIQEMLILPSFLMLRV